MTKAKPKESPITAEHRQLLHDKGVSDEVIDGAWYRPRYASYGQAQLEVVRYFAPQYLDGEIPARKRAFFLRAIRQTGGLIIIRRDLSDGYYEPPLHMVIPYKPLIPQLRPDEKITTGPGKNDRSKYLFPAAGAKMVDIHPMARGGLKKSRQPVYFCLEGSINADAVLSHGGLAFSVPGVTMWLAQNLGDFLPYLRDREVYVVTDSDLFNPMVLHQAMMCVEHLQRRSIDAIHASPVPDKSDPKRGVGDMLAAGDSLEDLELHLAPNRARVIGMVRQTIPEQFQGSALEVVQRYGNVPIFPTPTNKTLSRRVKEMAEAGVVERLFEAKTHCYFRNGEPVFRRTPALWRWL